MAKSDNSRKPSNRRGGNFKKGNQQKGSFAERAREQVRAKKSGGSKPKKDPDLIRLNKYIANAGICSRREADTYIAAGNVSVNGEVITEMGFKVKRGDDVRFDGRRLNPEKKEYVLLNKPKNFITTTNDEKGRRTVMELISSASNNRLYPVGRLDRATTGLLLFTNDGDLAKRLTHPKHGVRKMYHVHLDKNLKSSDLQKIGEGITLDDGEVQVDEISYVQGAPKKEIGVVIHSGRNRIVRRIFEHLGYDVVKLDRVVFAGLTKKDLPRGHWRFLTEQEVINLGMIR
ncbi:MAG: rRNA pseudouridine synthase [Flavobacteriaceae bacterium]|nr:rRNA pseudouridine synthase [Flavobacteriaceae bacterium]